MEFIDLSSLVCPGCHEPVDDGNEGFTHLDGSPLCAGVTEPVETASTNDQPEPPVGTMTGDNALDAIAHILHDPKWSSGMLEDIADLVATTGRSLDALPGSESTWLRH